MTAPEPYASETRHMMIIIDIRTDYAGIAAGGRFRLFLTDEGYSEVIQAEGRGDVKIIRHAIVHTGKLEYNDLEREQ